MSSPAPSLSALDVRRLGRGEGEALADISEIVVFSLPMNIRFRGITRREGLLLRGPAGWGECSPFWDYGPAESSRWLLSGLRGATTVPTSKEYRRSIPVNVTIPVCSDEEAVKRLRAQMGASTAKVKVADPRTTLDQDASRVRAVAETLAELYGTAARIRVDANTAWNVSEAAAALERLNDAAAALGGLEYAEQPVPTTSQMAELRPLTSVPLAADESIRRSANPLEVRDQDAADVAVLKVAPLGGVEAAEQLGLALRLPTVVSSALDTSIGLAAGVHLAARLPGLGFACGLNTATLLAADVIDEPLVATGGHLDVADARAVQRAELTRHAISVDADTKERWSERLRLMLAALREGGATA